MKRVIIYLLLVLHLAASGLLFHKFWPRAVEVEDVALIRLVPGSYGDMKFTNATILQLAADGYYQFRDITAPNNDQPLFYVGTVRKSINLHARNVTITGISTMPVDYTNIPWWERAWDWVQIRR